MERLEIDDLAGRRTWTPGGITRLLAAREPAEIAVIRAAAERVLMREIGPGVSFRGLVEFSNHCACDCRYCGIRRSNKRIARYELDDRDVLQAARMAADAGYGSIVLQAGERRDAAFVARVESLVRDIKAATQSEVLPAGLGITLSVGEQTEETYRRFLEAGAHRYLLRIETSDPALFAALHPPRQTFEGRVECLRSLRRAGYQVGTGVMIGLPGQTTEMLARDVLFFRELDVDMLGMGPYLPHADTPLTGAWAPAEAFQHALLMLAVCRLVLRDVNLAASTALQAVVPDGREQGLGYGANVVMPNLTPARYRADYRLYDGKPCLDEEPAACRDCLAGRVRQMGRQVKRNEWGDAPHAARRDPAATRA